MVRYSIGVLLACTLITSTYCSLSDKDISCGKNEEICWWALDIGNPSVGLYCNRNAPKCTKEFLKTDCKNANGSYGIKTTQKANLEEKSNSSQLPIPATLIFYCFSEKLCPNCKRYAHHTFMTKQIVRFFMRTIMKNENKLHHDLSMIEPDCPINEKAELRHKNANQCAFMIDSAMPTAVYSAALVYNQADFLDMYSRHQHTPIMESISRGSLCSNESEPSEYALRNNACFQGLSIRGYFLYCCCLRSVSECSYNLLAKTELQYSFEQNLKHWKESGEMRHEFQVSSNLPLALPRWTRRNFLFSFPVKRLQLTKKLWHCAAGSVSVTSFGKKISKAKLKKLTRENVPLRTEHCITYINLEFFLKTNVSYSIAGIRFDFLADSEKICANNPHGCRIVEPKCHAELVHMKNVSATFFCCCRQHDLCNTDFMKASPSEIISLASRQQPCNSLSYLVSKYILKSIRKQDDLLCEKYFDQHKNERLMVEKVTHTSGLATKLASVEVEGSTCSLIQYQPLQDCLNYTRRIYACKCKLNSAKLSKTDHCENNFSRIIDQINASNNVCYEGAYNLSLSERRYSICFSALLHKNARVVLMHRGGVSSKMLTTYVTNLIRRFKASNVFGAGYFIYTCHNKGQHPCNDQRFDTHIGHYSARHTVMKKPEKIKRYICEVHYYKNVTMDKEECISSKGCFDLHTPDGERVTGCIERIPEIIEKNPKLNALVGCSAGFRIGECAAMNSLGDNEMINGVLCCCANSCPKNANHPSSYTYGYHAWTELG